MISLEYVNALHQRNDVSMALKASRQRRENPALSIQRKAGQVIWEVTGVPSGTDEQADPANPSATHLDLYVFRAELKQQWNQLPSPSAIVPMSSAGITVPVGTERRGGKTIAWKRAFSKHYLDSSELFFPTHKQFLTGIAPILLNIDGEYAQYPCSLDGKRDEIHFGLSATWNARTDKRFKNPLIRFSMSEAVYNEIYATLKNVV